MPGIANLFPPLDLRITAGPIELRGLTDNDLPDLCELAENGIHDPALMPFFTPWTGETGSWLGLAHQGRGIGTAMRQALCAFVFDQLDATEITSGAFVDNPASLEVSRKVGYRPNGVIRMSRRGELASNQRLVLTPEAFVRGEPSVHVDGLDAFRASIGLPG